VVVIGGLISATILTLIVLPTLYVIFERRYHHGHTRQAAAVSHPHAR
jgi:Cu/Ag efflux pump CusA